MAAPLFLGPPQAISKTPSEDEGGGVVALSNGRLLAYWQENVLTQNDTQFLGFKIKLIDTINGTTGADITLGIMSPDGPDAMPIVTGLAGGGFAVSWLGSFNSSTGRDVFCQVYDATGRARGVTQQIDPRDQGQGSAGGTADITALDSGGFVAAWDQYKNGSWDSFARTYGADGLPLGNVVRLNASTEGNQGGPQITALAGGKFLAVWHDVYGINEGVDDRALVARIFDVDGTALTKAFVVNQDSGQGHDTAQSVGVTELAGGLVAMTWQHSYDDDTDGFITATTVVARIFNSAGNAVGPEFVVSTGDATTSTPTNPVITALLDGRFMVAWTQYTFDPITSLGGAHVMARVINADGSFSSDPFSVAPANAVTPNNPTITTLLDGRVVIGYHQYGTGWGNDLYERVLDPREAAINLHGSTAGDLILGTAFGDTVLGWAGGDVLEGGAGNDRLSGQLGRDTLAGGDGNDVLTGGASDDLLSGGAGRDVFVFAVAGGHDRVEDFTIGDDKLNLRSFNFADDVAALSHFSQSVDGAVFTLGGVTVLLTGVDLALIGGSALLV